MNVKTAMAGAAAGVLAIAGLSAPASAAGKDGNDQLYVANGGDDVDPASANFARFAIAADGLVTPEDTLPTDSASGLVFAPSSKTKGQHFAYAASGVLDKIDRYRVAGDGALTFAGTTDTPEPFGTALDPHGPTFFVANFNDGASGGLSSFHVEPDGTLRHVSTVDTKVVHPKGVAVTPDGKFVYVVHGTPRSPNPTPSFLVGYAVDRDGKLSGPVARAQIGPSGHRVVITPDGRFLYLTMQEAGDAGDVLGYRIGSHGELTPVTGGRVEAGTWVEGAAITPDGKRLYVTALGIVDDPARRQDGEVRGFDIGGDGRLTEAARVAAGEDPNDLAVGLDGRHVYVGDFGASTLTVFTRALRPVQTVPSQGLFPSYQGVTVRPRD